MAVSEMASSKSLSNLKPNKIQTAVMSALAAMSLSQTAIAVSVDDANVDNAAGTTITGTKGYGVKLDTGGPYTVANSGEISSTDAATEIGIQLVGPTITSLVNTSTGVIRGDATSGTNGLGISLRSTSNINELSNAGVISGSAAFFLAYGIRLKFTSAINTLTNTGTINGSAGNSSGFGIHLDDTSSINTLTNTGTIEGFASSGPGMGIRLDDTSTITTLTNSGTILGSAGASSGYGLYLDDASTINTLTNSGTIDGSARIRNNGYGLYLNDASSITTLSNTGTINGSAGATRGRGLNLSDKSVITTLTNSGTISGSAEGSIGMGIHLDDTSTITTLTNSGTISGLADGNTGRGLYLSDESVITTLSNTGTINGSAGNEIGTGLRLFDTSSINTLTNSGTISGSANQSVGVGIRVDDTATITTLTNSGTISGSADGNTGTGLYLSDISVITTLTNSGTISGVAANDSAFGINLPDANSTLTTLTNTGMITGSVTGAGVNAFGVRNNGSVITTFNNLQSGLTYSGTLPVNYNIIINGATAYGQMFVSSEAGSTNFGVSTLSTNLSSGKYTNVMTGVSNTNVGATRTGSLAGNGTSGVGTANWVLSETAAGSSAWDLNITGNYIYFESIAKLQNSVNNTANAMRGTFNSMTSSMNFANMTTYDCNLFGNSGGCVSVGGRYTGTDNPDTTATAVVAKAGYKFNEHFRYGAFVDQTANSKTGNVDLDLNTPMVGLMGVWNQNPNQLGMQVKLANTFQSTDASITRNDGLSTNYTGDTDINAQSYVAELSWHHLNDQKNTLLQPFVATRYAIIDQDGYSDGLVNYGSVEQKTFTALAGVKAFYQHSPKMTYLGSLGMEYDLDEDTDDLSVSVSGVSGLTAASLTDGGEDKTRFLGSVGARFFVTPNQRLEGKVMYEQLRYNNADSTTAYVNYTIGF